MALDVTPVNRNLHTRVTFMSLEFEDLFVVLGLAAVMNVVSHFFDGKVSAVLQYAVPLAVVPLLMVFKYGKPRGYMRDLLLWHTKPRAYCAFAQDKQLKGAYSRAPILLCFHQKDTRFFLQIIDVLPQMVRTIGGLSEWVRFASEVENECNCGDRQQA